MFSRDAIIVYYIYVCAYVILPGHGYSFHTYIRVCSTYTVAAISVPCEHEFHTLEFG